MSEKNRVGLLNHLIKTFNYKSYLEIGVHKSETFKKVKCCHTNVV